MANNKQFYLKEKKYVITKWLNDKKPLTEIARYLNCALVSPEVLSTKIEKEYLI